MENAQGTTKAAPGFYLVPCKIHLYIKDIYLSRGWQKESPACVLIHMTNDLFKVLYFWQLYCTKSKHHVLHDWINSSTI